ncbi:MAG: Flp family type IVb pilin [Sphingomonas bacterium]|nr:Flp family type IVb pilin [Sphingomonas bacterium]
MRLFNHVRSDRRGAAVAEYGLIAAVAGVAIAVASLALGAAMTSELGASPPCAETRC